MSSAHVAMCGSQSEISMPDSPCLLYPTCSGMIFEYTSRSKPTTERERAKKRGDFCGLSSPDSAYVFPAYLLRAGLGSNVSSWLYPPERKIQMTLLAFGEKCG